MLHCFSCSCSWGMVFGVDQYDVDELRPLHRLEGWGRDILVVGNLSPLELVPIHDVCLFWVVEA